MKKFVRSGLPSKHKRLYVVWKGIKSRCYNESGTPYKYYGGRGIKVCDEWLGIYGFQNFCKWALESGYDENAKRGECTIDRKDPNGDYCPENCCWKNMKSQSNNTRRNRIIEYKGQSKTLAEWVEELGLSYNAVMYRIDKFGWSIEKAFETPIRKHKKKSESEK